jgi:hypothetical protein
VTSSNLLLWPGELTVIKEQWRKRSDFDRACDRVPERRCGICLRSQAFSDLMAYKHSRSSWEIHWKATAIG